MKRAAALMRKEFIHLRRDPRLAILIFIAPLFMLFLFGYALRLTLDGVTMAVLDEDKSFISMSIKDSFWKNGNFVLTEVGDLETIQRGLVDGTFKAGLRIPASLKYDLADDRASTIDLYLDGTMPAIALAVKGEMSDGLSMQSPFGGEPITIKRHVLFNPDLKDVNFFLPGIIGILIMQVALILTSIAIVREKEMKTIEGLMVTPLRRGEFIIGKILPYAVIALLDFAIITVVGVWFFKVPFTGSPWLLALLAVPYILSFLALGVLISTISRTQVESMFTAVFILLPSVLLSGFVFPVESMPALLQPIPSVIPLTYFLTIIRGIMLKGAGLEVLWKDFVILSGFAVLFVAASIWRMRKVSL